MDLEPQKQTLHAIEIIELLTTAKSFDEIKDFFNRSSASFDNGLIKDFEVGLDGEITYHETQEECNKRLEKLYNEIGEVLGK